MHDPERLRCRCSATNAAGSQCGRAGKTERQGKWYCDFHDPDKAARAAELRAEHEQRELERDRVIWAAATVIAAVDGVRVFLIREDTVTAVGEALGQLPYNKVNKLMRMLAALPEAPMLGRKRVLDAVGGVDAVRTAVKK